MSCLADPGLVSSCPELRASSLGPGQQPRPAPHARCPLNNLACRCPQINISVQVTQRAARPGAASNSIPSLSARPFLQQAAERRPLPAMAWKSRDGWPQTTGPRMQAGVTTGGSESGSLAPLSIPNHVETLSPPSGPVPTHHCQEERGHGGCVLLQGRAQCRAAARSEQNILFLRLYINPEIQKKRTDPSQARNK